VGQ
ncbi:hypothetical protein CFC21_075582, partial [Triticum aestivum]|jgi:hypothetical protein